MVTISQDFISNQPKFIANSSVKQLYIGALQGHQGPHMGLEAHHMRQKR